MNKRCIIVIPIYSNTLTDLERLSLDRLYKVLGGKYDIIYATYEGIDFSEYIQVSKNNGFDVINYIYFPKWFFNYGSLGYNYLTTDIIFYNTFKEYEYMFLYHLDCYIFRDELEYWMNTCSPLIECIWEGDNYIIFNGEGLRRIESFINFIENNQDKINKMRYHVGRFILSNFEEIEEIGENIYGAEDTLFSTYLSNYISMPNKFYKFGYSNNYEKNYNLYGIPMMLHRINTWYNNDFFNKMIEIEKGS